MSSHVHAAAPRATDPTASDPPVDPRGVRFAAALTTVVLAVVLVTGSGWLLATQAAVFALGAFAGLRLAPYSVIYRLLVAPRLSPPTEREDAAPVRFSQLVGLVFAVVGVVGYLTGLTALGVVATAFALRSKPSISYPRLAANQLALSPEPCPRRGPSA